MNKKIDFILCVFLGYLGIHKFYEKKIAIGIIYMFTGGIFIIGWIYDCINLGIELLKMKSTVNNNSPQEIPLKYNDEAIQIIENTINDVDIEKNKNTNTINTSNNIKISKKDELANAMNPSPIWNEGTEAQQEFATDLVDRFCNRIAKYLCWGIKDNIVDSNDVDNIVNSLFMSIDTIDDAKWWCNKKDTNEFSIACKLLEDDELALDNIKELKKKYN